MARDFAGTAVLPALVIGAGPAGLTAALGLRALGIPVTLFEAEPRERVRRGSRALFVHHDSLRILDRLSAGLGARIGEHGIRWSQRRTLYRGRPVHERHYPPGPPSGTTPGTTLPPYASLRQIETENFLLDACHAAGVTVRWGARVTAVHSDVDGVGVHTEDGRVTQAEYVIAGDGARSTARGAIGARMRGDRSDSYHVVVDLADDPGEPADPARSFHYHHPGLDGRHVLVVPFTGGRQVDLQCRAGDDPQRFADPGRIPGWLPAVVGGGSVDRVLWSSVYPFLQLVADTFVDKHRRVLLVGEAAHLFAPFGARGMNSGIADADAAATAVAVALAAAEPHRARGAVEDFAAQRRGAAEHNCAAAGAALAHMRPGTVIGRARQRAAAALAPVLPRYGEWLERAPYGPRTRATPTGHY